MLGRGDDRAMVASHIARLIFLDTNSIDSDIHWNKNSPLKLAAHTVILNLLPNAIASKQKVRCHFVKTRQPIKPTKNEIDV